ncbi:flagellar basal body P-ring formation chaperone FlgA [Marinobacter sp. M216]|uniref:Flagella basal body P-ring formation protein FlgA n=1 Tax=Marinobacter albus TaxID=3030833 RepID=A0ABT7HDF5_9GAMM|nr:MULTISPECIES: flagellar basal body P-ring formation chaperone FlgA [unclassified Marinobacter]MBW7469659.1 flagellar basal body P-ring formation protein FlgA [Marinobacter sp. F4218]MDK9558072.1 flagellar basal body P-ring formation chaperone FlgA [Marinobacter sp. M216]
MRITIFALFLLLTGITDASAKTTADQIEKAASRFLEAFSTQQAEEGYEVTFEAGTVDDRLSLASCEAPLAVEFTGDPWKSTHPSLQVACEGSKPWRMFVTASVSINGPALIAARPLARGERVTSDMLTTQSVVVNASRRGVMRSADDVTGMEVRRPVNRGSVITPDLLAAPDAVERGDHVMITASSGGFSVTSRGKALANASIGEQVLVENLRTARTIRANVVAPGRVEIPM